MQHINELQSAQRSYGAASEAVKQAEADLARDIASFGNNLTPTQQQAYIEQYRREHQPLYDAQQQAARNLQRELSEAQTAMLSDSTFQPQMASLIADGYRTLASTPDFGAQTAQWVNSVNADPRLREVFRDQLPAINGEILGSALGTAANEYLRLSGGDPAAAAAQMTTLIEQLQQNPSLLETVSGTGSAATSLGVALQQAHAIFAPMAQGQFLSPSEMTAALGELGNTPLGLGLASAGLVFGIAGTIDAVGKGQWDAAITNMVQTAASGADIVGAAATYLANSGRFVNSAATVAGFASTASKVLGPLGAGLGFAMSIGDYQSNPNAGAAAEVIGNGAALVGAAMIATGVGAPFGVALVIGGTIASFIGNIFDSQSDREHAKAQLREHVQQTIREDAARLEAIGMTPEEAYRIASDGFYRTLTREQQTL